MKRLTDKERNDLRNYVEDQVKIQNDERKKIISEFQSKHDWVSYVVWRKYKVIDLFKSIYGNHDYWGAQMNYKNIISGTIISRSRKYLELVKKLMS